MMYLKYWTALLSLAATFSCVVASDAKSPAEEAIFTGMKSVTIYDSVSTNYPLELRERGTVYYAAENQSATFSESGILSRPLSNAETVYRIGTEDFLVPFFNPRAILGESEHIDETLKLHIDLNGEAYYAHYTAVPASRNPGTFIVKLDPMASHVGPSVMLQKKESKARAKAPETGDTPVIEGSEDEEDIPEKTFLQKYWIYAIPFLLVLVLNGAGGE